MSKALVVFSGGQDSTTCLYYAREHYDEVFALTFNYGQRHAREIESAGKIAELAGVPHEIIEMGPLFAGLSPLTNHAVDVAAYEEIESIPSGIADTFVPGRNILFLTIAANRAYVLGADILVLGVAQQDFGGYPDCRLDFIEKMEAALVSGLEFPLKIVTPLMHLTKEETVKMAQRLPGCLEALAFSTTCYNGVYPPCGTCNSCLLRNKGFTQAGVEDPLMQRFGAGGMA